MKIVALHTDFRIYWPARLRHLSCKLQERGDSLTIIEIAGQGSPYAFAAEVEKDAIDWVCLFPTEKNENLTPSVTKKVVIDKLNELNPDVVMAGAIAFTSGAAAVDWAKRNNRAVVIFDDSKKEDVKRNLLVDTVKKIIYSNVDAIFCPSKDWVDTYKYWGFKDQAVFYGVDVVDNVFWGVHEHHDLPADLPDKYLLTVGRQIERKNFQAVIDAFIEIKKNKKYSDIALLLVGDGQERSSLENSIPEIFRSDVYFYPFQDQSSLRSIYQHARVFILPSKSEQWGLVVNEAMASGLPVIVSKQCGCANALVVDGENGFVFSSENKSELICCMEKMIDFPQMKYNMMKEKSLDVISHWNLDRFSCGAMDAIDYAVKNKRRPFYIICRYILSNWNGRYNLG